MLHQARSLVVVAFALLMLFAPPLDAQRDFSQVEVEVQRVSENVYMLMGSGGNIGLSVGADGAFLIDDQFAPLTEKIKAAIRTVTDAPIEFLLNTHWHGDHTGGNENFGGEGALIVAHDNVYRRLNPEGFADLIGRSGQAPDAALPKVTFSETMTFHWNGEDIFIYHPDPAHTDGDAIVVFIEQNVIHMGDTYFNGFYPYIDVGSGGDVDGMIQASNWALTQSNSDTQIIPGHEPLSNSEGLRSYRDMLITVRDRVLEMKNDGMSEDAVVEAGPTRDFDADWMRPDSEQFRDGMIRFIYQSVGG